MSGGRFAARSEALGWVAVCLSTVGGGNTIREWYVDPVIDKIVENG